MGDLTLNSGGARNHSVNILLLAATGIPVSGTTYCGGFDQAVENGDLSNIFAHSTSIPIGGFRCQLGVFFRLWPTGEITLVLQLHILLSTIHSFHLFLVPRTLTAKSTLLIIRLPSGSSNQFHKLPSQFRCYSVLIIPCCRGGHMSVKFE
jgi:hypothetical protein